MNAGLKQLYNTQFRTMPIALYTLGEHLVTEHSYLLQW
jgi:hypothetical protein